MSATVRLTMAQALVRYLAAQRVDTADGKAPLFGGVSQFAESIGELAAAGIDLKPFGDPRIGRLRPR